MLERIACGFGTKLKLELEKAKIYEYEHVLVQNGSEIEFVSPFVWRYFVAECAQRVNRHFAAPEASDN